MQANSFYRYIIEGFLRIEAGLKDWDFVRNLPATIGDYTLVPGSGINGQILNIAAYVHEAQIYRGIFTSGQSLPYMIFS